jgi:hypothetical protein
VEEPLEHPLERFRLHWTASYVLRHTFYVEPGSSRQRSFGRKT